MIRPGCADRTGRTARVIIAAMLGLSPTLLAGCGFQPIYARRSDGSAGPVQLGLSEINVAIIPERSGQLLRQALQARLQGTGGGIARRYDLATTFALSGDTVGTQADNSVTRLRLVGVANWTLRAEDASRSTIASGVARAVDGLNIFDQQFFTLNLENEAVQRRMADAVAEQMVLQLAVYFKAHPQS